MDFNKVIMTGNLVRDPETKFAQSGIQMTTFSMAVNGRKDDEAFFFDCLAFDKTASLIAQYLSKGSPVLVEGYLKQERWEHEGQKRSKVKIIVTSVKFLGKAQTANVDQGLKEPEKDDDIMFFGSDYELGATLRGLEVSDDDNIPF